MFLRGVHFVFLFGVLNAGICASAENEKIAPEDLNYFCFSVKEFEKDPSKSPVLLIHDLAAHSACWNPIYEMFPMETGRKVCLVDLRNHGDSPWNNRTDVEAMTRDIEHFLDSTNIPKVNLIGHGVGGKISVHFALKHPERVDSLFVEDMRPNGITEKAATRVKYFLGLLQDAIKTVPANSSEDEADVVLIQYLMIELEEAGLYLEGHPQDYLTLRFDKGKWQFKMNLDLLKKAFENTEEFLTPSSGLYNGPTTFLYGDKSLFEVAGEENNIRKLFPRVKLVPVATEEHVLHGLSLDFLDEVKELLNNI